MVASRSSVQAGLVGEKGQRVFGANSAALDRSGVGVEAAWRVECDDRFAAGIRGFDEGSRGACEVAREADAEQAVDDQVPARDGRDGRFAAAAGGNEAAIGRGGVGRGPAKPGMSRSAPRGGSPAAPRNAKPGVAFGKGPVKSRAK